jgi:hypothetical protein
MWRVKYDFNLQLLYTLSRAVTHCLFVRNRKCSNVRTEVCYCWLQPLLCCHQEQQYEIYGDRFITPPRIHGFCTLRVAICYYRVHVQERGTWVVRKQLTCVKKGNRTLLFVRCVIFGYGFVFIDQAKGLISGQIFLAVDCRRNSRYFIFTSCCIGIC